MGVDPEDLESIRKSFYEEAEQLPDTMDGLANLVTIAFWALVWLAMGDRSKQVKNPAIWANDEVGGMLASFFAMHECGLSLETENWPWIERLRADLITQGPKALMETAEEKRPLLEILEREGIVLRNPKVQVFIRGGFDPLTSEVSQALRALQAVFTDSPETLLKEFRELASLSKRETRIIVEASKAGNRGKRVAHRLAAELAGGRCGLDVSSVLKYAQPGRLKKKGKKKI